MSFGAGHPDAELALADARCSLWWRDTAKHQGRRIGAIGHLSAGDAETGGELLVAACARLAAEGCEHAFGPLDGNTWRRYRAVVEPGDEPPFFLEPRNPGHWPVSFARAGFQIAATYASSLQEELSFEDSRLAAVERRACAAGVRIRNFDPRHAERELDALHDLAHCAFQSSFLFSPIAKREFIAHYLRLLPAVRPELVLIAEQAERPVGFLLVVANLPEQTPTTASLKTIAVRPGFMYAGLGRLLVAQGARAAAALGYRRAIHALMHEANASFAWSMRHGRVFRRYALYAKAL